MSEGPTFSLRNDPIFSLKDPKPKGPPPLPTVVVDGEDEEEEKRTVASPITERLPGRVGSEPITPKLDLIFPPKVDLGFPQSRDRSHDRTMDRMPEKMPDNVLDRLPDPAALFRAALAQAAANSPAAASFGADPGGPAFNDVTPATGISPRIIEPALSPAVPPPPKTIEELPRGSKILSGMTPNQTPAAVRPEQVQFNMGSPPNQYGSGPPAPMFPSGPPTPFVDPIAGHASFRTMEGSYPGGHKPTGPRGPMIVQVMGTQKRKSSFRFVIPFLVGILAAGATYLVVIRQRGGLRLRPAPVPTVTASASMSPSASASASDSASTNILPLPSASVSASASASAAASASASAKPKPRPPKPKPKPPPPDEGPPPTQE